MRALIFPVLFLVACGRVVDPAGNGDAAIGIDSASGPTSDGAPESGTRTDGCPVHFRDLRAPCPTPEKRCLYTEPCASGEMAREYVCQGALEEGNPYSHGWLPKYVECSTVYDKRGCPLGRPLVSSCSKVGLDCYYDTAKCAADPSSPLEVITKYVCESRDGGGVWSQQEKHVTCAVALEAMK
jgi:hypothetical protein